uniref:Uncharacterized protein n=1 Tax=Sus scrofa TaxID=9823 RepID=A0A8D0ZDF5_PIG
RLSRKRRPRVAGLAAGAGQGAGAGDSASARARTERAGLVAWFYQSRRNRGELQKVRTSFLCTLQSRRKKLIQGQIRCIENYTGARCEEVFLPSSSIQTESDLFTTFAALAVLLGTLIIGVLYFLCRKGHLQRASSVQYDISLVETSSTSAHHSHAEH